MVFVGLVVSMIVPSIVFLDDNRATVETSSRRYLSSYTRPVSSGSSRVPVNQPVARMGGYNNRNSGNRGVIANINYRNLG